MFLVYVPKGPACFANVPHCATQMVTLVPVNNPSSVGDAVFILRSYLQILNCIAPLEVNLDSCFITDTLKAFTEAF